MSSLIEKGIEIGAKMELKEAPRGYKIDKIRQYFGDPRQDPQKEAKWTKKGGKMRSKWS